MVEQSQLWGSYYGNLLILSTGQLGAVTTQSIVYLQANADDGGTSEDLRFQLVTFTTCFHRRTHDEKRTQSSHPEARMMKNLVYSRRATKRVPTMAKMLITAAVCCARGSIVMLAVVLTSAKD
jgi:hypothetical protein